jgi:hypothetical protein
MLLRRASRHEDSLYHVADFKVQILIDPTSVLYEVGLRSSDRLPVLVITVIVDQLP